MGLLQEIKMEHNASFCPNYFSIEDILATQERVPCQVESDLKNLGFLDPGSDNPDLARGSKMELPFWMVEGLRSNQARNYVSVDIPKTFKEVFREIMSADPLVVDLHKMGPYYYEFGRHLIKLSQTEGEAIGESISRTFMARFREILDSSQNSADTDTLKVTSKMDQLERMLYKEGQKTKQGMDAWLTRKTGLISTSAMVAHHRKRKADFD